MAITNTMYEKALTTAFSKEANWSATDVLKMAMASAYTYNISHKYFDQTPFTSAFTEVTNANGYTTGGVAVASQTISDTSNTAWTYSTADAVWTSTGTLTGAYSFLYDSTPGSNKPLLLFVNFGGNVTASSGATITIHPNSTWLSIVVTGA